MDGESFCSSSGDDTEFEDALSASGRLYYIVRDAALLRFRTLPQTIDLSKTVLLTYLEPSHEDEIALGLRIIRRSFAV